MDRVVWLILAVVLALAGWEMLLRDLAGQAGWLPIGVGLGIATAVVGSALHDALAGTRDRR